MTEALKGIAARYASALKVAGTLQSSGDGEDRPSIVDIWLWKLEEAAARLVKHGKTQKKPYSYDSHYMYAHRFCLNTAEDVGRAPDRVLLEAMQLSGSSPWGWLQFIVRDLGWHSMIANNWGWPVLLIPDGVMYDEISEDHRRAQAVAYFLELWRESGVDYRAEVRVIPGKLKARFASRYKEELHEPVLLDWLKRRNYWIHMLYAYSDKPVPSDVLTKPKAPLYSGDHHRQFAGEIRQAAARRRKNREADWSCDCARLQAAEDEREGLKKEREHVAHVLKGEMILERNGDIGVVPDCDLLAALTAHWQRLADSEYHIKNAYLGDRLDLFLARNEKARDLLRLPENRELALKVKNGSPDARMGEARGAWWLYVPDA